MSETTDDLAGLEDLVARPKRSRRAREAARERRIVAAVNACKGIPTTALEAGVVGELVESVRDWLYFAEKTLYEFDFPGEECGPDDDVCPKCQDAGCIQRKIRAARAALAKLTPEP